MYQRFISILSVSIVLFLAGCASKAPIYSGISYPATKKAPAVFQEKDVPAQCDVFAHLIVHTPAGLTGAAIGEGITDFAKEKGADLIYVGLSRKATDDENKDFEFFSYGPKEAYQFSKEWFGWKFGYSDWEESGRIIGFGYDRWHDTAGIYDFSLKIQAVLLRCAAGNPLKKK